MKLSNCLKTLITATATALAMTSCDHKELCYTHPHSANVNIAFDWRNCPTANPAGMTVYFYNLDDAEAQPMRFDFVGPRGGEVTLPLGNYEAICVNSDTEFAHFYDTFSMSTFIARTRKADVLEGMQSRSESTPVARGTEDEICMAYPDDIYCDTIRRTTIAHPDINYTIEFRPEDILCHYTYEITNCENLKFVRQIAGTISGMSPEMLLASRSHPGEHSIIPFSGTAVSDTRIEGAFQVFGHLPTGSRSDIHKSHQRMIYAVLADGSGWYKDFDVTEQVHNARDYRNVHIKIDGLKFPEPIQGDPDDEGGFQVGVSDWTEVEVVLPM